MIEVELVGLLAALEAATTVDRLLDEATAEQRFYLADLLRRCPDGVTHRMRVVDGARPRVEDVVESLRTDVRDAARRALGRHQERTDAYVVDAPFRGTVRGLEVVRARPGRLPVCWLARLELDEGEPVVGARVVTRDDRRFVLGHRAFLPIEQRARSAACPIYGVADAQLCIGDELVGTASDRSGPELSES